MTLASEIFANLSTTQYLSPHVKVDKALVKVLADRVSSIESMTSLLIRAGIDHHAAIGRLKRVELEKLSEQVARLAK